LARANTGLAATVMKSRKGLPKALKEAKVKKGEKVFHQKNNVLALRWRDERDVWMLGTRHTARTTKTSKRQVKEKMKPMAVADYNKEISLTSACHIGLWSEIVEENCLPLHYDVNF
jgi:hypothetical protein